MYTQKIWDLPVRVCHWGLVLIIVFQYLSAEVLDDTYISNTMQWHFYAGYTCIALVIFRVCWGVFGTYYAKFSQFVRSPAVAIRYLLDKQSFSNFAGHNPAGAFSVIVLLTLVLTQALSGLFVSDEIFNDGPFYGTLSDSAQSIANFLHHNVFKLLFGFIGLHVGAIIYYKIKHKEALTKAMISGYKTLETKPYTSGNFPWVGFFISLLITVVAMYLILEILPVSGADDYYGY